MAAPTITEEDINKLKVITAINKAGQPILLKTYQIYKKFPDAQNIEHYLINDQKKTEKYFKDGFNNNQTYIKVIRTTPATGEKYDVSLLGQCIKVLRKIYEPRVMTLLDKCQKLVDIRNHTFHSSSGITDEVMKKEIKAIKKCSIDILECLENKYPAIRTEISDIKTEYRDKLDNISKLILGEDDLKESQLQQNLEMFKKEIPSYKIKCCEKWGKIKFLEYISPSPDSTTSGDIDLLFTDVVIKSSKGSQTEIPVACEDMIPKATASDVLLISSDPGGGKSTIMQRSIYDFGKGENKLKTEDYDFIFPMVFRNKNLKDVGSLIRHWMPGSVADKMSNNDIEKCIVHNSLSILFYCDGWDEQNSASSKLFQDICDLKIKETNINIIVSSRPASVMKLYDAMGSNLSLNHLEVRGIREDKIKSFLEKHHNKLVDDKISKENTVELLMFYDTCSAYQKELYRLPLNLLILTYLWAKKSETVKQIRSEAGLYEEILEILVDEKLLHRISEAKDCSKGKRFRRYLDASIDKVKAKLYKASLESLSNDSAYIDKKGVESLEKVCKEEKLEFSEFQDAFLLTSDDWKLSGNPDDNNEGTLKFAHKGIMEYLGAKSIESMILEDEGKKIEDILKDLHKNDPTRYECNNYQNVVTLLGGIIALNEVHPNLADKHGPDIIDFLKKAGTSSNEKWYAVYANLCSTDSAPKKFGPLIVPHLDKNDFTIRDSNVEVLSTLLEYVDISEVTLDIRSYDNLPEFPTLLKVLKRKKHKIILKNITIQADSLTFSNDPQINSNEVSLFTPTNL